MTELHALICHVISGSLNIMVHLGTQLEKSRGIKYFYDKGNGFDVSSYSISTVRPTSKNWKK